jgi:mRNA export factor
MKFLQIRYLKMKDATLKYWDPRQGITPVGVVNTQKKVYAVDVTERTNLVVVACADRVIHVIDLNAPTTPYTSLYSPLKFQSKCVANFADGTGCPSLNSSPHSLIRFCPWFY